MPTFPPGRHYSQWMEQSPEDIAIINAYYNSDKYEREQKEEAERARLRRIEHEKRYPKYIKNSNGDMQAILYE